MIYVTVGEENIVTTPSHPFYVEGRGWIVAGELAVGDSLRQSDVNPLTVTALEKEQLDEPIKVYNFEVEGFHTYFVGETGVLVHNKCGAGKSLTDKPGKIAHETGRTVEEIKDAIEQVKKDGKWRSDGNNKNPDVFVDPETGYVYPKTPNGGYGDEIGNIFDYLPEK